MKPAILIAAIPLALAVGTGSALAQFTAAGITETISTANTVNQSQQGGGGTAARAQQQARQQAGQLNAQQQQPAAPEYDQQFANRYGEAAARNQARAMRQPQAVAPAAGQPGVPGQPGVAGVPVMVRPPAVPKQADPDQEERIINFQRQNAISGNPSAQYDLGMRYLKGDGVEQDDAQALNWLSLSAKNGNSRAKKQVDDLQKKVAAKSQQLKADAPAAAAPEAAAAKAE